MAYKPPKIIFKKAASYTEGRSEPIRAFVNHRMVGTLAGTDAAFLNPSTDVSTHFGIGLNAQKQVEIHQYVPLDDTAWGNGVINPGSNWEKWGFKTTEINPQTISIEHQDMDGTSANRGKVSIEIQMASQWLQALLFRGHEGELKKYGVVVRDWTNNWPILRRELKAIPRDNRHIITHKDIAPSGKPYCWAPWAKDTVGFPRTVYVTNINKNHGYTDAIVPDPVTPPPTPPKLYTQAELDAAVKVATDPLKAQLAAATSALTAAEAIIRDLKDDMATIATIAEGA